MTDSRNRSVRRPAVRRVLATAAAASLLSAPLVALAPAANAATGATWDRLAQCESTGNWAINTGNGYSGGLQFSPSTWTGFGGGQYAARAHQATREQQIAIAEKVLDGQGWGAWPACSRKLGLTAADAAATDGAAEVAASREAPTASRSSERSGGSYVVVPGDTLSRIAAAHGTTWQALHAANAAVIGADPNRLRVGTTLAV